MSSILKLILKLILLIVVLVGLFFINLFVFETEEPLFWIFIGISSSVFILAFDYKWYFTNKNNNN